MAFTQNSVATLIKQPQNGKVQITASGSIAAATGAFTGAVTIYTAGANGSKINSLVATSTDTAAQVVVLGIFNGTTYFALGAISVPANAGTTTGAVAAVNVLGSGQIPGLPVDSDGNPYLHLVSGDTLVGVALGLTASHVINMVATAAGDF